MEEERKEFFENELRPQLDAERLFIDKAAKSIDLDKLDKAKIYLNGALLINPDSQRAKQLLDEVGNKQTKITALEFIKNFYPTELDLFDTAWRVFRNFKPVDFKAEAVSGALGIAGREPSQIVTPKIIFIFNQLYEIELAGLTREQIKERIIAVCDEIECQEGLSDQIIDFILE
jgi:hypothetical protein